MMRVTGCGGVSCGVDPYGEEVSEPKGLLVKPYFHIHTKIETEVYFKLTEFSKKNHPTKYS